MFSFCLPKTFFSSGFGFIVRLNHLLTKQLLCSEGEQNSSNFPKFLKFSMKVTIFLHQKRTDFTLKPSQNSQVKQISVILEHCLDFEDSWYYQTELMFQRYICVQIGLPRRRQWQPTPVLLPGKSLGRRRLVGFSPWGREESDRTERLHFDFSLIGEGNGNSLQCSCPENARDSRAWWAAVYGVAQSRTRLK